MLRKTLVALTAATAALLVGATPALAGSSSAVTARAAETASSSSSPGVTEKMAAGTLYREIDARACATSGGANGYGFVNARGYMEENGATNVTRMQIQITTQQAYTTAPRWRNVPGTTATYPAYSFAGSPNSASHFLYSPSPGQVYRYSFSRTQGVNNYVFRIQVKFIWSNSVDRVQSVLYTPACTA